MRNALRHLVNLRPIFIIVAWMTLSMEGMPGSADAGELDTGEPHVVKRGLTAYNFDISYSDDPGNQIIFVQSSKSDYTPHFIGGSDQIGSLTYDFPATLPELISDDAPVVVAGAYNQRIGGALLPLGYLKSRNFEISPRFHHSWLVDSVFCTDARKSKTRIFSTEAFENDRNIREEFSDCAQTGPRLLEKGKNAIETQGDDESVKGRQRYIETSRIQLFLCKADDNPASPLGVGITTG
ncbi:MAG: hypothetical protein MN733_44055, partial [Nitrososphaera sp.]|nr:hypothetical protein [Nitrososphaera sp.]